MDIKWGCTEQCSLLYLCFIPNSLTCNENISIIEKLFIFNLSIPVLHLFKVTGIYKGVLKCPVQHLQFVLQCK